MWLSRLVVTPINGRQWKLQEPLVFEHDDQRYEIPAGFVTDFASTPRLFWAVFPPFGRYTLAAVLHDYLYRTQPVARKDADRLFLLAMVLDRTALYRAWVMWAAVRLLGGRRWRALAV